ncbi:ORFY [Chinaberry tree badnavirus 1]|uniref:ORFY n=1 Tax=Chinaberry tree badnavirus 1 TaxID=2908099 RepID=UPI002481F4BF|nr:ORFY [Chinaberry tree badnavirus 1]UID85532.1 ORFY [Chinaberry tree badnavirus 1]
MEPISSTDKSAASSRLSAQKLFDVNYPCCFTYEKICFQHSSAGSGCTSFERPYGSISNQFHWEENPGGEKTGASLRSLQSIIRHSALRVVGSHNLSGQRLLDQTAFRKSSSNMDLHSTTEPPLKTQKPID